MRAQPRDLSQNLHGHEHGAGAQPSGLLLFPAYTILPLIRSPLGYDIIRPYQAIARCLPMAFLPYGFWFFYSGLSGRNPPPEWGGQGWLLLLMVASATAACATFAKRAREMRTGIRVHGMEAGYSALTHKTMLPIPLTEIILMPLAIGCVGWLVAHSVSFDAGWWLVLCAFSYCRMAFWEHSRFWALVRQPADEMIRAKGFERRFHEQDAKTARPRQGSDAAGGDTHRPGKAEPGSGRRAGA